MTRTGAESDAFIAGGVEKFLHASRGGVTPHITRCNDAYQAPCGLSGPKTMT
jgi:hypothetical protein